MTNGELTEQDAGRSGLDTAFERYAEIEIIKAHIRSDLPWVRSMLPEIIKSEPYPTQAFETLAIAHSETNKGPAKTMGINMFHAAIEVALNDAAHKVAERLYELREANKNA